MIRSLRARHRGIFVLLALTLPVGFTAALLARRTQSVSPSPSTDDAGRGRTLRWDEFGLELGVEYVQGATLRLRLRRWSEPAAPGLLLYWCPLAATDASLPGEARLLGSLGPAASAPRDFSLNDVSPRGWLVLYSLGHAEVLGQLQLNLEQEL